MYTKWELREAPDEWEIEIARDRIRNLVKRDRSILASMYNVLKSLDKVFPVLSGGHSTHGNNLIQMIIDRDYEPHDDNIYRVHITGRKASVVCLGLDSVDAKCVGEYYVSRLPKWIQRRLAVLLLLESPPSSVEGVGVRLETDIFWVFKDGNKSLTPDTSSHGD